MLLYATLGTSNLHRSVVFYDAVSGVLGAERLEAADG